MKKTKKPSYKSLYTESIIANNNLMSACTFQAAMIDNMILNTISDIISNSIINNGEKFNIDLISDEVDIFRQQMESSIRNSCPETESDDKEKFIFNYMKEINKRINRIVSRCKRVMKKVK